MIVHWLPGPGLVALPPKGFNKGAGSHWSNVYLHIPEFNSLVPATWRDCLHNLCVALTLDRDGRFLSTAMI